MKDINITLVFVLLCSFVQGQTKLAISDNTPVISTFLKGDNVEVLLDIPPLDENMKAMVCQLSI